MFRECVSRHLTLQSAPRAAVFADREAPERPPLLQKGQRVTQWSVSALEAPCTPAAGAPRWAPSRGCARPLGTQGSSELHSGAPVLSLSSRCAPVSKGPEEPEAWHPRGCHTQERAGRSSTLTVTNETHIVHVLHLGAGNVRKKNPHIVNVNASLIDAVMAWPGHGLTGAPGGETAGRRRGAAGHGAQTGRTASSERQRSEAGLPAPAVSAGPTPLARPVLGMASESKAYLYQPLGEQNLDGLLEDGEQAAVVDADPPLQQGQHVLHLQGDNGHLSAGGGGGRRCQTPSHCERTVRGLSTMEARARPRRPRPGPKRAGPALQPRTEPARV